MATKKELQNDGWECNCHNVLWNFQLNYFSMQAMSSQIAQQSMRTSLRQPKENITGLTNKKSNTRNPVLLGFRSRGLNKNSQSKH